MSFFSFGVERGEKERESEQRKERNEQTRDGRGEGEKQKKKNSFALSSLFSPQHPPKKKTPSPVPVVFPCSRSLLRPGSRRSLPPLGPGRDPTGVVEGCPARGPGLEGPLVARCGGPAGLDRLSRSLGARKRRRTSRRRLRPQPCSFVHFSFSCFSSSSLFLFLLFCPSFNHPSCRQGPRRGLPRGALRPLAPPGRPRDEVPEREDRGAGAPGLGREGEPGVADRRRGRAGGRRGRRGRRGRDTGGRRGRGRRRGHEGNAARPAPSDRRARRGARAAAKRFLIFFLSSYSCSRAVAVAASAAASAEATEAER